MLQKQLLTYREELSRELDGILKYWIKNTPDLIQGGFIGQINEAGLTIAMADKGSVLNARILWSFSAAFNLTGDGIYLQYAERAFKYISSYFIDKQFGGVYWSVNYKGVKENPRKQIYATAFTIYGLAEYYRATRISNVLDIAVGLYKIVVEKSHDQQNGGYFEAFDQDWSPIEDLRLSQKDINVQKSMNTNLHILEAFSNLYSIWPDQDLKYHIRSLLTDFTEHIIHPDLNAQVLFFDNLWNPKSTTISYGHDIEASWLLLESGEITGEIDLIEQFKVQALKLATQALTGLDTDGGLFYEFEPDRKQLITEKHWWVQAEAMVGFFNAWEISNNQQFLDASLKSWQFTKQYILDKNQGEWFWGVGEDHLPMPGQDKVGIWKCPYHNTRACIELIRRISINPAIR